MYYYPNQVNQQMYPFLQQTANPMQMQQQQQMPPQGLKGRPVSSIEEVRAAQIDFDGSLFVFPDMANKKIYTKQINLDGTATLNVYEQQKAVEPPIKEQYVTQEEFNKFKSLVFNNNKGENNKNEQQPSATSATIPNADFSSAF